MKIREANPPGGNQDILALLLRRCHADLGSGSTTRRYQKSQGNVKDTRTPSASEEKFRFSGSLLLRAEDGGSDLRAVCDGVGLLGAEVTQDVGRLPLTRVVDPWTSYRETEGAHQLWLLLTRRRCTSKQQPPQIVAKIREIIFRFQPNERSLSSKQPHSHFHR